MKSKSLTSRGRVIYSTLIFFFRLLQKDDFGVTLGALPRTGVSDVALIMFFLDRSCVIEVFNQNCYV